MSEMLNVVDVAATLKMSKASIQRWCRDGRLPAAKIGKEFRIRRSDLEAWYESKLRQPVGV